MSNCRGAWKKQSLEKYKFIRADKPLQILICDVTTLTIWVLSVIKVPHRVFLLFVAGSKCVLTGTMAQNIAICAGDSNFKDKTGPGATTYRQLHTYVVSPLSVFLY